MKIVALLFLLAPALASAAEAYQSPATVAKRVKAQCAALAPQQRRECETKGRAEVRASIDKHHAQKRTGAGTPATKARGGVTRVDRKKPSP